jgi:hypothetical protein
MVISSFFRVWNAQMKCRNEMHTVITSRSNPYLVSCITTMSDSTPTTKAPEGGVKINFEYCGACGYHSSNGLAIHPINTLTHNKAHIYAIMCYVSICTVIMVASVITKYGFTDTHLAIHNGVRQFLIVYCFVMISI